MEYILEWNKYYSEGDIVLIEYWYNNMITPVEIIERVNSRKFRISHNCKESKIQNAPNEVIKSSDVIDHYISNK